MEIILHSLITEVACSCQGWDKPSAAKDTELLVPHTPLPAPAGTPGPAPWTQEHPLT